MSPCGKRRRSGPTFPGGRIKRRRISGRLEFLWKYCSYIVIPTIILNMIVSTYGGMVWLQCQGLSPGQLCKGRIMAYLDPTGGWSYFLLVRINFYLNVRVQTMIPLSFLAVTELLGKEQIKVQNLERTVQQKNAEVARLENEGGCQRGHRLWSCSPWNFDCWRYVIYHFSYSVSANTNFSVPITDTKSWWLPSTECVLVYYWPFYVILSIYTFQIHQFGNFPHWNRIPMWT